jgi:catechol 2,3-dioxygenase
VTAPVLPADTTLGAVQLRVADLARALDFYARGLGLAVWERDARTAVLGVGERPLLRLVAHEGLRPADPHAAGLYHTAFLFPDRAALATVVRHLLAQGQRFTGASDHLVSEAFYLDDPDGNGVELYRDRPRAEWPRDGDGIAMATLPLDAEALLAEAAERYVGAPAGTVVGHVHLQVGDVAAAQHFYCDVLGFAVMARFGSAALFVAAGGYHHHLGLNVWRSRGAGPGPRTHAGLDHLEVLLPDAAAVAAVVARAEAAGVAVHRSDAGVHLVDPWGIEVVLGVG